VACYSHKMIDDGTCFILYDEYCCLKPILILD
jgi:hypothetical protein